MIAPADGALFAVAFGLSAAAPGPEVAALLARSVSRGVLGTWPLASGIIVGKLVMLGLAVAGLAALVTVLGPGFVVLQYAGALYLVWLGVTKWRRASALTARDDVAVAGTARVLPELGLGLALTLSNPIAITFYLALLPGVVDVDDVRLTDFAVLALILAAVMSMIVLGYGLAGELVRRLWRGGEAERKVARVSATVFVLAGGWILVRAVAGA